LNRGKAALNLELGEALCPFSFKKIIESFLVKNGLFSNLFLIFAPESVSRGRPFQVC